MPISPDLAIFFGDDRRRTKPIALPLAHAHGVISHILGCLAHVRKLGRPIKMKEAGKKRQHIIMAECMTLIIDSSWF